MNYLGAPKYSKIEIILKENNAEKILNEVLNNKVEHVKIFDDCGVMITGNHLLVIQDNFIDVPNETKYTETHIFELSSIKYYKIFNY